MPLASAAFVLASTVLAVTPGPGVAYIVTQTLSRGRTAGIASVGGIALGNLGNAAAASVGLAVVLSASSVAFTVIKLMGAAYLVFLGIKALRTKPAEAAVAPLKRILPARLFRDGFFVALFNPKTALFFGAFLPQFIDPAGAPLRQTLLLGGCFVAIALCTDTLYVLIAAALARTVGPRSRWRRNGQIASATTLIGLGVYAALAIPQAAK